MKDFAYVYILESIDSRGHFYTGLTDDLADRLSRHNRGEVSHTAKFRPWQIKCAIAFRNRQKAAEFEAFLKTASGRTFAKKHL